MTVTAQYAAEHFEELVSEVDRGESVEITRPGLASLQLGTTASEGARVRLGVRDSEGRRILGTGKGRLRELSNAEWEALDREFEHIWDVPFGVPEL